ncbi:MAG TPA: thiamine phosphate synthase [Planctomycetota bacterium]|nr:thiamine phosphate synthase [Planctomycetota bacterium]
MHPDRARALRVMLITDGRGDTHRIQEVVRAAVEGGVRCVQLREPRLGARELAILCGLLHPVLTSHGGLLLVNDRADVAAAGVAHGVHLGRWSLLPGQVRTFLPPPMVVGVSAHNTLEVDAAVRGGADYVTLSPVLHTQSHPAAVPLGPSAAAKIAAASTVPVVWLGGITKRTLGEILPFRPFGIAVMRELMDSEDPRGTAAYLCTMLQRAHEDRPATGSPHA